MNIQQLDKENLQRIFEEPLVLLYKHSPICPLSLRAHNEVTHFSTEHPTIPVYIVDVIAHRSLSMRLAAETGVQHQSPQVILMRKGEPVWNTSHMGVRSSRIESQLKKAE